MSDFRIPESVIWGNVMYIQTEGIIISHKDFQEADKLLTIYTKTHGKISCIAKGARRPRSKKAGHIELGTWCKLLVARGKNIDLLCEVETKRAFGLDNLTFTKSSQIYHLLELVDYLTEQHQANERVFSLLANFLKKVNSNENFKLLASVFKIKLLSNLGFFSSHNLKNSDLKKFFETLESQGFDKLQDTIKLEDKNYLKLSAFLDSMIENLAQRKLKTARFIYG